MGCFQIDKVKQLKRKDEKNVETGIINYHDLYERCLAISFYIKNAYSFVLESLLGIFFPTNQPLHV
jgi:hypothetical protein